MTELPALHSNVQGIVSSVFGITPDRVVGEAKLVKDLGATSLESVELIMSIEDSFDIEISDTDAARVITIDDLERLIRQRQDSQTPSREAH